MTKKKSITKNYIYNVSYQVLALITPLITTPYLSRVLEADGIGIYSFTAAVVSYFNMFASLGTLTYGNREISYLQDDRKARSQAFWEIEFLSLITTSICAVAYICFVLFGAGDNQLFFAIQIFTLLTVGVDVVWFFQGMEEFKKIIKRNLIVKAISILSIFLFIKTSADLNKYLLIYALSVFIGNLSLCLYLPKYITKVSIKSLELKKHLKPTIALFIPQIATQIYTVLDKTMIGSLIADKAEVGFYEQSQKIVKVILTIVTSLGTVMLPRIANKFANGQKEEIKKNILTSFNFVYFLSMPMVFGLIAVTKDLIPWFLGEGFEKSIYITYQ